jgi:hypothetical protein
LDADGDPVSFVSAAGSSANGGTVVQSDGWLYYTPATGFAGEDSFTYTISDGRGTPVTGTVSVVVEEDLVPSPNLTVTELGEGSYLIQGNGVPGKSYRIQYTESMGTPTWITLGTATANTVGAFEYNDTTAVGQRFYRSIYP